MKFDGQVFSYKFVPQGRTAAIALPLYPPVMYCSASQVTSPVTIQLPSISSTVVSHGDACTCSDTRNDLHAGSVAQPPTTCCPTWAVLQCQAASHQLEVDGGTSCLPGSAITKAVPLGRLTRSEWRDDGATATAVSVIMDSRVSS